MLLTPIVQSVHLRRYYWDSNLSGYGTDPASIDYRAGARGGGGLPFVSSEGFANVAVSFLRRHKPFYIPRTRNRPDPDAENSRTRTDG